MSRSNMEDVPLLDQASNLEAGLSVMRSQMRPSDKDLRVLIFTASYFILDGVTLTIRRIASHLRSKHAVVKIVTTVPANFDKDECDDSIIIVPGIDIPLSQAGSGYGIGVDLSESTIREMERFKPNCVHFTVPDFIALEAIKWCQQNNVAFMATWHSQYSDYLKFYNMEYACYNVFSLYMKGFYEQIPVVYVPTPYIIKKMEADGLGKHTSIQQWGRGVDLKLFNPNRYSRIFRESKNISENEVVILWVGRLVPEKRPDIYLDIVERLAEEGYPVKGLVVGSGSYEATLAEVKCVTCCGWLAGTALAEAYASCEVLVFPSAVETFGSVTLEALASGCVPIVENNCGKHLVQDKFNGFTCPDGDVEAYYEAAKSLVVDAVMRKKMSVNAREYSKQYDRDVILQQMLEFYKDAIVRHQDPSFIVNHMKADPIASGSGIFATLCCHYYFVKALVYPFMHSANGITNLAEAGKQCMKQSRSKLNLGDYLYSSSTDNIPRDDSRFDDYEVQKKALSIIPHSTHPAFNAVNIMKFADIFATAISYFIVLALIAATFIV